MRTRRPVISFICGLLADVAVVAQYHAHLRHAGGVAAGAVMGGVYMVTFLVVSFATGGR